MEKSFYLLTDSVRGHKFGVVLEKTECGIIGIVNCHFSSSDEYEILITDSTGENFYGVIKENPYVFRLPSGFVVDDEIIVDIYSSEELIATNQLKSVPTINFEQKGDLTGEELAEAQKFIEKTRGLYSEEKPASAPFFDKISGDFNLLYNAGEDDFLLSKKFKNSVWRRVDVAGESYILGKIYAGSATLGEEPPSFVALAQPTTGTRAKNQKLLGPNSKFYHANIYDDFGFEVLVQNAFTGKAVRI